MSKSASSKRKHRSTSSKPVRRVSDVGGYVAFALIWAFVSFVAFITARDMWYVISVGLIAAFVLYVTLCTSKAYAGQPLMQWQKGLVRLPLMLVGAGRARVEEVKRDARARTAVGMWLLLSLILIGITLWLLVGLA